MRSLLIPNLKVTTPVAKVVLVISCWHPIWYEDNDDDDDDDDDDHDGGSGSSASGGSGSGGSGSGSSSGRRYLSDHVAGPAADPLVERLSAGAAVDRLGQERPVGTGRTEISDEKVFKQTAQRRSLGTRSTEYRCTWCQVHCLSLDRHFKWDLPRAISTFRRENPWVTSPELSYYSRAR